MPNDAKLGLLVGAAGVLVAAVLIGPKSPASAPVAATETGIKAAAPAIPPARAAVPRTPSKPANTDAPRGKPELAGKTVGRER